MKRYKYLCLELAWFLPVIAGQWWLAGDILRARWKAVPLVALPIAAHLTARDKVALQEGTWAINADSSTGLKVGGVPIEEAIIFLLTSWVSAQGIVMLTDERSPEILDRLKKLLRVRRDRRRKDR